MTAFLIPEGEALLVLPEPYEGAEITVDTTVSLAGLLDMQDLMTATGLEPARKLSEMFLAHLKGWNLEDKDGPLPVGPEGWERLGVRMQVSIIRAWVSALTMVDDPFGEPSDDTGTSED